MKLRRMLAGALIAGVASLGVGGVAVAQDTGTSGDGTTTSADRDHGRCVVALLKLEREKAELEGKIDVLQRERNAALENHRFELARRLEVEIIKLQARKAVVEAKIHFLRARCGS